jgi:dTDP-4-amino-4,6-dideoxygalactose transaminase
VSVPLVDLAAQHAPLQAEIVARVAPLLASGAFIGGEEVEGFEREFAVACGTDDCIGVANGTDALRLALLALGVGPGDEVITVSHTFVATAEAIAQCGATPVFVDVDAATGTMDAARVAASIGPRTAAVVPVHLYGRPAPMDEIVAVAERYGLPVVEDACQAHGASYRGRAVGSLATAACFSFYPTKNLGAAGDGGAVVTSDPAVAAQVRLLRDHGSRAKYDHQVLGWNSRLDAIQAAVLRVKLPHLASWNDARRGLAERYRAALADCVTVTTPPGDPDERTRSVHHLFVVRVDDRDRIRADLAGLGIETGLHYPTPVHRQPAFANGADLPVTDAWAASLLSLPMYPELGADAVDRVCAALTASVGGASRAA